MITGEQIKGALEEILDLLLGPIRKSPEVTWEDSILGLSKHQLLLEALRELYRHRSMQSLAARYRELLDESERLPP